MAGLFVKTIRKFITHLTFCIFVLLIFAGGYLNRMFRVCASTRRIKREIERPIYANAAQISDLRCKARARRRDARRLPPTLPPARQSSGGRQPNSKLPHSALRIILKKSKLSRTFGAGNLNFFARKFAPLKREQSRDCAWMFGSFVLRD